MNPLDVILWAIAVIIVAVAAMCVVVFVKAVILALRPSDRPRGRRER